MFLLPSDWVLVIKAANYISPFLKASVEWKTNLQWERSLNLRLSLSWNSVTGGSVFKSGGGKFLRALNDYNLANRCYRKYINQNVIDYTLCKASRDLKKGDFSNFFYERMQSLGVLVDECKQIYDALRLILSLLRNTPKSHTLWKSHMQALV